MSKKQVDNNSEKLRKKHIQEQLKRIKPGECQKHIKAIIDENVLQPEVGEFLLRHLTDCTVNHDIRKQKCARTIIWERNVGQQVFNVAADSSLLSKKYVLETQLLRVFSSREFHTSIEDKTIHKTIINIQTTYPDMQITLVVVGVLPKSSNQLDMETSFVELQILYECSIHFVGDPSKLAELVVRFTKAVAEIPYKKQRNAVFAGSSQFLLNDNKDCVRVNGSIGLGRLWQQHLNRLPLVTLDVAQTILNKYPCPKMLLDEFKNNPDGPTSLANLKVTRGAVPLSSQRRIGEALSKKLYALYNSTDPTQIL